MPIGVLALFMNVSHLPDSRDQTPPASTFRVWTEQRHHVAGGLGRVILGHFWLRTGRAALSARFGIDWAA